MTKSVCSFLACLFLGLVSKAQNTGGGVDDETLHFGFNFQYITSEFSIQKQPYWRSNFPTEDGYTEPLTSISSPVSPGFGLGFVSDLRLGYHGNLRFTPALAFPTRFLEYSYQNGDPVKKEVKATLVELPLGFKLKSDKKGNFRAYFLAGAKYSMDITSKKKTDDLNKVLSEKLIKNKSAYLSYEAAIGFDFYFEYFKLSPELKFSHSLGSILKSNEEPNPYLSPLDKLYLRNFQLSLYFE